MDPTLVVLVYSGIAAGTAALGALPLVARRELPQRWIGWALALAAGMMLAAAYLLIAAVDHGPPWIDAVAAALGVLVIHATHTATGGDRVDPADAQPADPAFGYRVLLIDGLHAGTEGIAIGAAMAIDLQFGIFMALAMAAHNVPEAAVLASVTRTRGARAVDAAGLAVATNVPQVLMAVAVFAVLRAAPTFEPWVVGFAVGALVQLVLVELLPGSYRRAGTTSIALVAVVAMAAVVLLQGAAGAGAP